MHKLPIHVVYKEYLHLFKHVYGEKSSHGVYYSFCVNNYMYHDSWYSFSCMTPRIIFVYT